MDFDSFWKTASVLLAGAFGALGLLTEFRDKETGKLTVFGFISLTGICLSTFGGVWASLASERKDAERSAREAAYAQTVIQTTEESLRNIERLLTPLGNTTDFHITLEGACPNAVMLDLCQYLASLYRGKTYDQAAYVDIINIAQTVDPIREKLGLEFSGIFYADSRAADARILGSVPGDLNGNATSFSVDTFGDPGARGVLNNFCYYPQTKHLQMTIFFVDKLQRRGSMTSWKDIYQSTFLLAPGGSLWTKDLFNAFTIDIKIEDNVGSVHVISSDCQPIRAQYHGGTYGMVFIKCPHPKPERI